MLLESLVFMVCMAYPIEQIISKKAIRQCEMCGFHIIIEYNILVEACVCDKKKIGTDLLGLYLNEWIKA